MPSLETSFFDRLNALAALRQERFSLSKKSPKGGFFGKMVKGDERCTKEKETDVGK